MKLARCRGHVVAATEAAKQTVREAMFEGTNPAGFSAELREAYNEIEPTLEGIASWGTRGWGGRWWPDQ